MNKKIENKYLNLIVRTFEELQPITELTIEEKRNAFRKIMSKKFSEEEQKDLRTKEDFINDNKQAIKKLKNYITKEITQIRNSNLNRHIVEINFGIRDKNLINHGDINVNRKKEIKSKTEAVNNLYGKGYPVNITSIVDDAKNQMCIADIEFIQSTLEFVNPLKVQEVEYSSINSANDSLLPFKNNFDRVSEHKVLEYFTRNLVEKKYLSQEKLVLYLKQAFELKSPPENQFSFEKMTTQNELITVFHNYFKTIAGKPYGRKMEYIELLGEYFNGFDSQKIDSNFSK